MAGNGFNVYVETGKFTSEFFNDLKYLAMKVYYRRAMKMDFEDFYSFCVDKIYRSIGYFDPTKSIGTFLYKCIYNECSRLKASKDNRQYSIEDSLEQGVDFEAKEVDYGLVFDVNVFVQEAFDLGIVINPIELYSRYTDSKGKQVLDGSPILKAFLWCKARKGEKY